MPPKVLFTASTYSHIRNFHLPYLRWFHDQGWIVHAACGGAQTPIPYADEVLHLPLEKRMAAPGNFRASAMLRRKIKAEGYDFLSVHTSLAAFFSRIALIGLRHPPAVANMAHGYLFDSDTPWHKRMLLLSAERLTAPQTDLLLTMNCWDFETAQQHHLGKRIVNVPGVGVDFSKVHWEGTLSRESLREEFYLPRDAFILIYPAEFSGRKSQSVLIRAMAELPAEVVLVLAGDGVLREECQSLARSLGLENRVIFPGHLRDMAPWYAMADAAVTASRSEGLPFNVMEAMYAGLPVVASAVKGHVDLIQDGETGLLYPYGSSVACASAVRRLLDSQVLRQHLAKQARDHVMQYSIETVFPVVTEAYMSLLPMRAEVGLFS